MPSAKLSLFSHSGNLLFDDLLDFSFLPLPGQIISMQGHPAQTTFPDIEKSEPYFAVVSVIWNYDAGQMIPYISASYSAADGGGVFPEDVFEANKMFYPFAASRLGE